MVVKPKNTSCNNVDRKYIVFVQVDAVVIACFCSSTIFCTDLVRCDLEVFCNPPNVHDLNAIGG